MPVMTGVSTLESVFMTLIFIFGFGSTAGWVLELFFRRFISTANPERKWINPGFLIGPCLPIYGFGLLTLFVISLIPYMSVWSGHLPTWGGILVAILTMGVLMTLIEYIAGLIFIKKLNLKLWDYSEMKGNIQGIICPQFSLIWTVMGALYYFFLQPYIIRMVRWLYENVGFIFFLGIYFGILIVDIGYSFNIAARIREYARDNAMIVKYEELKDFIKKYNEEHNIKNRFFNAFRSNITIRDHLDNYMKKITSAGRSLGKSAEEKIEKVKDIIGL